MLKLTTYLITAVCVFSFCACGSTGPNGGGGSDKAGISITDLPIAKKGCAQGGVKVRSSISNAQDFAATTARANLAATMKETVQQMVKRYVEEGQAGDRQIAEELNTRVMRGLTELDVIGGVVTKSYMMGDEVQVIVCIEPDAYIDAFDKMKQLSQKQREALKARAKTEFRDMDKQLETLRNRGQ